MSTQVLNHAQKVTRLYRKSLKNLLSWTVKRELWRKEACELRAVFDTNKHVDMVQAAKLLDEGEAWFQRHKHPDPYICESLLSLVPRPSSTLTFGGPGMPNV